MIDERKLLEEIEKWKNTVAVNTYQDEILQLCIDVFRKKVESQPKVGEWIPVSERLPYEDYETVLCLDYEGYYFVSVYTKNEGFRTMDIGTNCEVIAWITLPEPYKPQPAAGNETDWKESMMQRFTKGD